MNTCQMSVISTMVAAVSLGTLSACSPNQPSATMNDEVVLEARQLDTSIWPKGELRPALDADIEQQVATLLSKMSVEEKVGQIIQPELKYITPEEVKKYHIGSILNGGGTTPNNDKRASIDDWLAVADSFYLASMDASDGKVAIPLMWGTDAVHGHNNVYGATYYPHNIGLGAAHNPDLIEKIGRATAKEVAATGIDWTFGPTVAVARDTRWGRAYESYSEDPAIVKAYAGRMVQGIQGGMVDREGFEFGEIVSTAKHFVGDGGTYGGIDRGDTAISEQALFDIHAQGYISALDANVLSVMASFNSWNGSKVHGDKHLLTDVLKDQMGFAGFVVGDWNAHRQIPGCTVSRCAAAINAGLDMFMVPEDWRELYDATLAQATSGEIAMSRLDDAVTRILRVKLMSGLFDAGLPSERASNYKSVVGAAEHRDLARDAVRQSLVLLKNNASVLPVKPEQNILVAGKFANDIAAQNGGWTLSWQGTGNSNADYQGSTSIFQGIEAAAEQVGSSAIFAEGGEWRSQDFDGKNPDVAIVVFGEAPYAEWHGDIASIEYERGVDESLNILANLKAKGIPTVSVFLSGRPLWVNRHINASDAFVAAWLPGSEGAGIADVLLAGADGNARFDFSGKLSFSWPKAVHQTVLNVGDYGGEDPLFPYGYGLSYEDSQPIDRLSEAVDTEEAALQDMWVFVSRPVSPWQQVISTESGKHLTVTSNTGELAGAIKVQSVDKISQEDARAVTWSGEKSSLSFIAEKAQRLDQFNENSAVLMDVNITDKQGGVIDMAIGCSTDAPCPSQFVLNDMVAAVGGWQSLAIPWSCLPSDIMLSDTAIRFTSEGNVSMRVANIKFVPQYEGPLSYRCTGE